MGIFPYGITLMNLNVKVSFALSSDGLYYTALTE